MLEYIEIMQDLFSINMHPMFSDGCLVELLHSDQGTVPELTTPFLMPCAWLQLNRKPTRELIVACLGSFPLTIIVPTVTLNLNFQSGDLQGILIFGTIR